MPDTDDGGRWLPLKDAAPLLGLERDTLRKQLARGERQGRRDNRGRWLVLMPASASTDTGTRPGSIPEAIRADAGTSPPDAGIVPDERARAIEMLREQTARLEERLAAAEEARAELRRELGDLKTERDRLLTMLDAALAEQRRRRWPGLKIWWRRFWAGEG